MTKEFSALKGKSIVYPFDAPRLREHHGRDWKHFKYLKSKMIIVKLCLLNKTGPHERIAIMVASIRSTQECQALGSTHP